MAIGGGMSCVKYLLFCFNLLFAITGLIILVVGARAAVGSSRYMDLTHESFYLSGPIILVLVGIIIFVVAFFGCCGAVKENHCMIVTFSVFLIIIFVAEVAVGIAGYVKHQEVETSILNELTNSLKEYPTNPSVRKSFDIMQTDLMCCGVKGPHDWANASLPVPESCCSAQEIAAGSVVSCAEGSDNIHKTGCLPALVAYFKEQGVVLGGVGVGIAITQLLGVIFACGLARSIRSQYETV